MKPKIELAHILNEHSQLWLDVPSFSFHQQKVLQAITLCRTSQMGMHIDHCSNCEHIRISYNSCRNRHCPKCQASNRELWIAKRGEELLPVPYFHLVFTLPHHLNRLAISYPKLIYNTLFKAAWATLKTFGANQLQGKMGMTAVLHTWSQNLSLHPHLHCIVPGGALDKGKWLPSSATGKYLFSVKAMAKMYRAKFCNLLRKALKQAQIAVDDSLFKKLFDKPWVVYAKRPFLGPKQVVEYLGRYSHKVAISNHRLVAYNKGEVTFNYKDYRKGGQKLQMTLTAKEFIRRFALHILPTGFVRIRHFGFLAPSAKKQALGSLREELAVKEPMTIAWDWVKIATEKLHFDPLLCTCCGKRTMVIAKRINRPKRAPPTAKKRMNAQK